MAKQESYSKFPSPDVSERTPLHSSLSDVTSSEYKSERSIPCSTVSTVRPSSEVLKRRRHFQEFRQIYYSRLKQNRSKIKYGSRILDSQTKWNEALSNFRHKDSVDRVPLPRMTSSKITHRRSERSYVEKLLNKYQKVEKGSCDSVKLMYKAYSASESKESKLPISKRYHSKIEDDGKPHKSYEKSIGREKDTYYHSSGRDKYDKDIDLREKHQRSSRAKREHDTKRDRHKTTNDSDEQDEGLSLEQEYYRKYHKRHERDKENYDVRKHKEYNSKSKESDGKYKERYEKYRDYDENFYDKKRKSYENFKDYDYPDENERKRKSRKYDSKSYEVDKDDDDDDDDVENHYRRKDVVYDKYSKKNKHDRVKHDKYDGGHKHSDKYIKHGDKNDKYRDKYDKYYDKYDDKHKYDEKYDKYYKNDKYDDKYYDKHDKYKEKHDRHSDEQDKYNDKYKDKHEDDECNDKINDKYTKHEDSDIDDKHSKAQSKRRNHEDVDDTATEESHQSLGKHRSHSKSKEYNMYPDDEDYEMIERLEKYILDKRFQKFLAHNEKAGDKSAYYQLIYDRNKNRKKDSLEERLPSKKRTASTKSEKDKYGWKTSRDSVSKVKKKCEEILRPQTKIMEKSSSLEVIPRTSASEDEEKQARRPETHRKHNNSDIKVKEEMTRHEDCCNDVHKNPAKEKELIEQNMDEHAQLHESQLQEGQQKAQCQEAQFQEAQLHEAQLHEASLHEAQLQDSQLHKPQLQGFEKQETLRQKVEQQEACRQEVQQDVYQQGPLQEEVRQQDTCQQIVHQQKPEKPDQYPTIIGAQQKLLVERESQCAEVEKKSQAIETKIYRGIFSLKQTKQKQADKKETAKVESKQPPKSPPRSKSPDSTKSITKRAAANSPQQVKRSPIKSNDSLGVRKKQEQSTEASKTLTSKSSSPSSSPSSGPKSSLKSDPKSSPKSSPKKEAIVKNKKPTINIAKNNKDNAKNDIVIKTKEGDKPMEDVNDTFPIDETSLSLLSTLSKMEQRAMETLETLKDAEKRIIQQRLGEINAPSREKRMQEELERRLKIIEEFTRSQESKIYEIDREEQFKKRDFSMLSQEVGQKEFVTCKIEDNVTKNDFDRELLAFKALLPEEREYYRENEENYKYRKEEVNPAICSKKNCDEINKIQNVREVEKEQSLKYDVHQLSDDLNYQSNKYTRKNFEDHEEDIGCLNDIESSYDQSRYKKEMSEDGEKTYKAYAREHIKAVVGGVFKEDDVMDNMLYRGVDVKEVIEAEQPGRSDRLVNWKQEEKPTRRYAKKSDIIDPIQEEDIQEVKYIKMRAIKKPKVTIPPDVEKKFIKEPISAMKSDSSSVMIVTPIANQKPYICTNQGMSSPPVLLASIDSVSKRNASKSRLPIRIAASSTTPGKVKQRNVVDTKSYHEEFNVYAMKLLDIYRTKSYESEELIEKLKRVINLQDTPLPSDQKVFSDDSPVTSRQVTSPTHAKSTEVKPTEAKQTEANFERKVVTEKESTLKKMFKKTFMKNDKKLYKPQTPKMQNTPKETAEVEVQKKPSPEEETLQRAIDMFNMHKSALSLVHGEIAQLEQKISKLLEQREEKIKTKTFKSRIPKPVNS